MRSERTYPRTRIMLLVLATAASVAVAGKGGEGHGRGGGNAPGHAERSGGPQRGSAPHEQNRGGERAKPSHSAKPATPQGHTNSGARPAKPAGPAANRSHDDNGRHGGSFGHGNDPAPAKAMGRSEQRVTRPMPSPATPFRAGAPVWKGRVEAVRGRPVFTERKVVLDQRGWGSGWHYGWRNKPVKPVVITTPHYTWHEAMYVPVQRPFSQMGCQVTLWGGDTCAVVAYEDRELVVVQDSPEVVVVESGIAYPVYWSAPPVIHEHDLYVPVRPTAVSLGLAVAGSGGGLPVAGGFSFASTW